MGRPKALMPWGNGLLIDAVIAHLRPLVDEIVIVAKDTAPFVKRGVRTIADRQPERHPWVGVCTGLGAATCEASFVCACDMPWLEPAVIRYLHSALHRFDAVVPRTPAGLEPLHAIYTRRCLPLLESAWKHGVRTLHGGVEALHLRVVTASELEHIDGWQRSFANVNSPEDYARAVQKADPRHRTRSSSSGTLRACFNTCLAGGSGLGATTTNGPEP